MDIWKFLVVRLGATHAGTIHAYTRDQIRERKWIGFWPRFVRWRDKLSWWMIHLFLFYMRACCGCLCRWIWAGCEKVAKRRWAQKRAKGISFEKTATLWLCYYLQEERDAALLPQQINLPLIFIIYQRGDSCRAVIFRGRNSTDG